MLCPRTNETHCVRCRMRSCRTRRGGLAPSRPRPMVRPITIPEGLDSEWPAETVASFAQSMCDEIDEEILGEIRVLGTKLLEEMEKGK